MTKRYLSSKKLGVYGPEDYLDSPSTDIEIVFNGENGRVNITGICSSIDLSAGRAEVFLYGPDGQILRSIENGEPYKAELFGLVEAYEVHYKVTLDEN